MRRRIIPLAVALLLSLCLSLALVPPAQAFDPVTLIAKEIVKSLVKDFIRSQVMGALEAQLGPCRMAVARMGVGPDAALVKGTEMALDRGLGGIDKLLGGPAAIPSLPQGAPDMSAMQGMQGMPQMAGMPDLAALQKMQGMPGMAGVPQMPNMPGLPNMPSMPGMPAGMSMPGMPTTAMMGMGGGGMSAPMQAQMQQQMQALMGSSALGANMPATPPEQMAMIQQMQTAAPLTQVEAAELGDHMGRLASAFPDQAPCSPAEIKYTMSVLPMMMPGMSGAMRPVLDSMRKMDLSFAEARKTFASMTPGARKEYVELTVSQLQEMDAEERKAFQGLLRADFFGMPEDMRAEIGAALEKT